MMFSRIAFFILLITFSNFLFAQTKPIKLYPDTIPNSKEAPANYAEKTENDRVSMVTDPVLIPFLPPKGKSNGTAVIICPGGGYVRLSMKNEGYDVAEKFAAIGVTAFVLKYRLPSDIIMMDKTIGPLQDAERAIQIIRIRADEMGINPKKVGIIGFSAGGHLASTLGTHFDQVVIANKSNISLRPDFMMLLYPVITFGEMAHKGSMHALLGENPTQAQLDLYSNEKQVRSNSPITFIVQAEDDKTVPVQNSLMFYYALLSNNIATEMHIYPKGGHGFGLNNTTTKDYWFNSATNWLDANGLLTK